MVRFVTNFLLPTFILFNSLIFAAPSNQEFCASGVDKLAIALVADLESGESSPLIVSVIEGRFGEALRGRLAERLRERGFEVYLAAADSSAARKYLLQSTINEYSLKYVGSDGSAFRQGKVVREFAINATKRLLERDGKLVRTFEACSVVLADTLSFDQARRAKGSDLFLSPALPPTMFQRVVEPGIIAGVTGILVYLFFASR
jgi:hypothetical protein